MLEINYEAHLRNLTIISGGAGTVGVGGYLTGGGHAALSSTYGLAADQVLEMEIVTPGGDILTINECQNTDLFWAMRGVSGLFSPWKFRILTQSQGGGSTFGVITSVTFKAYQSMPFIVANAYLLTAPGMEAFWDVIARILSQYPALDAQGVMTYSFVASNFSGQYGITTPVDGFLGTFILPVLHPGNTSESLATAVNEVFRAATAAYPSEFKSSVLPPQTYPDFWAWFNVRVTSAVQFPTSNVLRIVYSLERSW
jgi:FAD/FMN-containing dehydrogenase